MQHNGSEISLLRDKLRRGMWMSEAYRTFPQMISEVTRKPISSPVSADGRSPCGSPAGPTKDLFGQEVAPVSPSQPPERARQPMTNATCGLRGFLLSASYALQSSLESRLRRRLVGAGSTLFSLIWRAKATPAGRPYCQLAASVRPTSDNEFGSWPTPMAGTPAQNGNNEAGNNDSSRKTVELAAWPSPCTPNGGRSMSTEKMDATGRTVDGKKHTASLEHAVKFSTWPIPRTSDTNGNGLHGDGGADLRTTASWATPTTRDHKDGACQEQITGGGNPGECIARTPSDPSRPWDDLEWIDCSDGKARPTQSGIFPLAHGVSGRVGRLRAYGNAIVPQVAAEFIKAVCPQTNS